MRESERRNDSYRHERDRSRSPYRKSTRYEDDYHRQKLKGRSRSRDRDAHSSAKSEYRDKDVVRDRDRDRNREMGRDRERFRDNSRDRDNRGNRQGSQSQYKSYSSQAQNRKRSRSRSTDNFQTHLQNDLSSLKKHVNEITLQNNNIQNNGDKTNIHNNLNNRNNADVKIVNNSDNNSNNNDQNFNDLRTQEDDEPIPDDLEIDFEDPDERRLREEAEAKRSAEERKRRLEEIKSKYHTETTTAAATTTTVQSNDNIIVQDTNRDTQRPGNTEDKLVATGETMERTALPTDIDFENDEDTATLAAETTVLRAEDEGEHLMREKRAVAAEEEKNIRPVFDIFSSSPANLPPTATHMGGVLLAGRKVMRESLLQDHLAGNWDDGEGYYRATIGEVLAGRYQVQGVLGKGVFSTVLKCVLVCDTPETAQHSSSSSVVAVKLIRNNETMRKAAEKEKKILQMLRDNKRFCVRLLHEGSFEHRHHVGFVFEYQAMNLRETLKKFGKDVGIAVSAVRIYGRQLLVALYHLASLRVVHADFKLDNILCSEDLKTVKLCDFGSAFFETDTDNNPTPYLVSRFYRAPEIILGLNYDRSIDLWALCVCLYELFTGHVMFPGRSNNEMLRLIMEVKGKVPQKLLRQHLRSYETLQLEPHFSGEGSCKFRAQEVDAVTGKVVLRLVDVSAQPLRPVQSLLQGSSVSGTVGEAQWVHLLADLLEQGLCVDPARRLKVQDALKHPFFATNTSHSSTSTAANNNNNNNNGGNKKK